MEKESESKIVADQMSHFSDETVMGLLHIFNTVCAFRVNIYKYTYVYSVITSLKGRHLSNLPNFYRIYPE